MTLDILTPKGQITAKQEQDAINIFEKKYLDWNYIQTPKDTPCAADGFVCKKNVLQGVIETKCREMTFEKLKEYDWEWLLTMQKIIDCVKISESLHVPFYGFLYLVPDKTLLIKKIWDNKKGFVADFNVIKSVTQATVNGGSSIRANAYIKMDDATVIKEEF
jgi:hypothetical protein